MPNYTPDVQELYQSTYTGRTPSGGALIPEPTLADGRKAGLFVGMYGGDLITTVLGQPARGVTLSGNDSEADPFTVCDQGFVWVQAESGVAFLLGEPVMATAGGLARQLVKGTALDPTFTCGVARSITVAAADQRVLVQLHDPIANPEGVA